MRGHGQQQARRKCQQMKRVFAGPDSFGWLTRKPKPERNSIKSMVHLRVFQYPMPELEFCAGRFFRNDGIQVGFRD